MPAYVVGHLDIHDRTRYRDYEAAFMEIFERYGGEVVAADDRAEPLEGQLPSGRTVLLRFPDRERATAWWESADYQAIAAVRREVSDARVVLVEGR